VNPALVFGDCFSINVLYKKNLHSVMSYQKDSCCSYGPRTHGKLRSSDQLIYFC